MAAPAVTGAVALYKASRPNATPAEVKEALQYLGNLDWKTSTDPDSYHEKLLDVSRLGPLGTFGLDTSAARLHERARRHARDPGHASTAAATFFERVRFSGHVAAVRLDARRSAVEPARLDRGRRRPSPSTCPDPVPAGTYHVGVSGHEPGPDRHRRP